MSPIQVEWTKEKGFYQRRGESTQYGRTRRSVQSKQRNEGLVRLLLCAVSSEKRERDLGPECRSPERPESPLLSHAAVRSLFYYRFNPPRSCRRQLPPLVRGVYALVILI